MISLTQAFWDLPPPSEWLSAALILGALAALIGLGELVRSRFEWSPEFTRKLVHVNVGVLIVFTPSIFSVPLPAIILAVIFIVVNLAALRLGLLKGMHSTDRPTYGTVYYPLAFLLLILLFWYRETAIISLSILVLAFGDAAAAIVGESRRKPALFYLTSDKKSVEGSIAMFAVSLVILTGGLMQLLDPKGIPLEYVLACAGIAAVTGTAMEAISSRGLDNLTIPLSVAFVLSYFVIPNSRTDVQQFTLGASLGIFVVVASYKAKFLSSSGAVAAFLLALVVFGVGGWKWTVPLVAFFLLTSLLSKFGSGRKEVLEEMTAKNSVRDHAQVFANGGIAGILVLLSYWFPQADLYPVYLGSIAAVTADTWGTELGTLRREQTVLLTSFTRVVPGTNGGVSLTGIGAGLAGSLIIAGSALFWIEPAWLPWIVLAGMAGSVADSFLGATFQARYRCSHCERITERRVHCNNQPTVHEGGLSLLTNDGVNWVCAGTGAAVMIALILIGGAP